MDIQFKHITTKQIDSIAAGDNEFKIELVNIFLEQIDEFVSNMKSFVASEDWVQLAREAHTAKSSAMTFGMDKTGQLLKRIQLDCEALELENVLPLVTNAIENLQLAIPELNTLKDSLQK